MSNLSDIFKKYMEEAIGQSNAYVAFSAFDTPASVSIRLNPFKFNGIWKDEASVLEAHFGQKLERVSWSKYGYYLNERPVFTLDPLFHSGAYYVQDSSSMYVGETFRACLDKFHGLDRPIRVLDLCAAPGGKTTDLSTSLREAFGDQYILVANEVIKTRATILAENVAVWGDPNIFVTSLDPSAFSKLPGHFDLILADVPCSGEGMFRKDEQAVEHWSKDNVALCQSRQRRILADVWTALANDGVLIYSTCTFNKYENDDNVEWLFSEFDAENLSHYLPVADKVITTTYGASLVPGLVRGEGQYVAVTGKQAVWAGKPAPKIKKGVRKSDSLKAVDKSIFAQAQGLLLGDVVFELKGDLLKAVPKVISQEVDFLQSELRPLATGVAVGRVKAKTLVPDADLALSFIYSPTVFTMVNVDRAAALEYLHHDSLVFAAEPKGYLDLRYCGVSLGFVKNLGNRVNSLHPMGRRIKMNIR